MAILNIITFDETEQRIETPLPDPQTMQWDSADVEAEGCSGTNQLGEYFRNRLGLANGAYVHSSDLMTYGRTDVAFYKIDEEQYYMDFSINTES